MTELRERLERLGLSQYVDALISEGFDSWETVSDIQESDLEYLNIKLGHRRKLQRAIAEARGLSADRALPDHQKTSLDASYRSDDSAAENKEGKKPNSSASNPTGAGTKRKYRRHPKPDENAPERPASAYVIFSNQVREELRGQDLSFTDIAKIVGERWQVLPPDARDVFERQAATAKEKYYAQLAEYKKTTQYAGYQEYLVEFKAKHASPRTEGKRTKLEPQVSTSTHSSSRGDAAERPDAGRSSVQNLPDGHSYSASTLPRTDASPTVGGGFPGPPYQLPTASPTTYGTTLQSPSGREYYSPKSTSPASATPYPAYELPHHARSVSLADRVSTHDLHVSQPAHWSSYVAETDPAKQTHSLTSPRRTERVPSSLPPLAHADTTLASDSSGAPPVLYQGSLLPVLDAPKADRMLPQPIPTADVGLAASPVSQQLPMGSSTPASQMPRGRQWPALLRASELARDADRHEASRGEEPT